MHCLRYFLISLTFGLFFLTQSSSETYAIQWQALHDESRTLTIGEINSRLKAEPDDNELLYLAGLVYLYEYDYSNAKSAFEKLLELDPESHEAEWGLCELLRREHKLNESSRRLKILVREHPDFSPAFITLGFIKYLTLDFHECIRLAEHVIDQGIENVDIENFVRAHLMITAACGMLTHHGNPFKKMIYGPRALRHLKIAEKILPNAAGTLFAKGTFYLLAPRFFGRDLDKAEKLLLTSIKKDPNFVDSYVRLAQVYKWKGNQEKYREYMLKARQKDPLNELLIDMDEKSCNFICK